MKWRKKSWNDGLLMSSWMRQKEWMFCLCCCSAVAMLQFGSIVCWLWKGEWRIKRENKKRVERSRRNEERELSFWLNDWITEWLTTTKRARGKRKEWRLWGRWVEGIGQVFDTGPKVPKCVSVSQMQKKKCHHDRYDWAGFSWASCLVAQ